jgi:hypothetical protein
VQADEFVAEHSTHDPELVPFVRHAGSLTVVQAAVVPEPRSPSHGTHVPAELQIGVAPEHWAFVVHSTHL